MGDPTSSYATAGIALRVSGALKFYHHDKVETPSVGKEKKYRYDKRTQNVPGKTNTFIEHKEMTSLVST
jgi:hypothetical protein